MPAQHGCQSVIQVEVRHVSNIAKAMRLTFEEPVSSLLWIFHYLSAAEFKNHVDGCVVLEETMEMYDVWMTQTSM